MNTNNSLPEMHMLLLGMSHEHVLVEIKALGFRDAVIFTSENLDEDAKRFADSLAETGVEIHDIVTLEPFKKESLETMTEKIVHTIQKYTSDYQIICGLTGGTNLMAISMALAALKLGLPCHYSIDRVDAPVIKIDYLKKEHKRLITHDVR